MPEKVVFHSQGAKLVGNLWRPGAATAPAAAVLVMGSWTTVKEQMAAEYGRHLAEAGFLALSFDFRGFGESEGSPRDVESAASKTEDIRNAVAFLHSHPAVDPGKIGALSICASSGYVAAAAHGGIPLRSIAMVAPWLHDAEIVAGFYAGPEGIQQRLAAASAARARYANSGEVEYVPAASTSDPRAAMCMPGDALDYYLNPRRGAVPQWNNRFAVMAWTEWLEFDAVALAPKVSVPVRLVTSEQSATPGGARQFEARLTVPHDSVWMTGTQFDFYDDAATVAKAAAHAIAHLRNTLT